MCGNSSRPGCMPPRLVLWGARFGSWAVTRRNGAYGRAKEATLRPASPPNCARGSRGRRPPRRRAVGAAESGVSLRLSGWGSARRQDRRPHRGSSATKSGHVVDGAHVIAMTAERQRADRAGAPLLLVLCERQIAAGGDTRMLTEAGTLVSLTPSKPACLKQYAGGPMATLRRSVWRRLAYGPRFLRHYRNRRQIGSSPAHAFRSARERMRKPDP